MTKLEREQHAAAVDRYGVLDAKLQPIAAEWREREALARTIRAWHAEDPGSATFLEAGEVYEVTLSEKQQERRIVSMPRVFRKIGAVKFVKLASMTLTALESALGASDVASLTAQEQTGSRKLTVRAKGDIAKAAA